MQQLWPSGDRGSASSKNSVNRSKRKKKKKKKAPSKRKNVSVAEEEEEKGRTLEELLLVNPSPVAAVEAFSRLSFPPSLFYDCRNHCIPEFWGFGPAQTGIGARA